MYISNEEQTFDGYKEKKRENVWKKVRDVNMKGERRDKEEGMKTRWKKYD